MVSLASEKPHAVCVPYPAQGHMNPMLKLAKLLHTQGFHITFVVTEFNYRRLVRSQGREAVQGLADFRFASIPDGLAFSDEDATQNIVDLSESTMKNCLDPFLRLIAKLNEEASSPVTCIISDGLMSFTLDAAREFGIPEILLWTTSACGLLACLHFQKLVDCGLLPLKDATEISNGFLNTQVDWIPGLKQGIRLKDLPTLMRITDLNDKMFNFVLHETSRLYMASAIVINTFEVLESLALSALQKILPPIYTIGPLSALCQCMIPSDSSLTAISTSLWKEDTTSIDWLDGKKPQSVVYVNFGSITVMTNEQLAEFAWGLANSGYDFLWVIRPDLVKGEFAVLPQGFMEEIKGRGLMTSWCVQEEILCHPTVGVFLTHSGWNSTLESLSSSVPMICWPFFADQQINCLYSCTDWGVGMDIDNNVRRVEVEGLIREMMVGEKGRMMRAKALEWKESATEAASPLGSSAINLGKDLCFKEHFLGLAWGEAHDRTTQKYVQGFLLFERTPYVPQRLSALLHSKILLVKDKADPERAQAEMNPLSQRQRWSEWQVMSPPLGNHPPLCSSRAHPDRLEGPVSGRLSQLSRPPPSVTQITSDFDGLALVGEHLGIILTLGSRTNEDKLS